MLRLYILQAQIAIMQRRYWCGGADGTATADHSPLTLSVTEGIDDTHPMCTFRRRHDPSPQNILDPTRETICVRFSYQSIVPKNDTNGVRPTFVISIATRFY